MEIMRSTTSPCHWHSRGAPRPRLMARLSKASGSMAEIERTSYALLARILLHHPLLDHHTALNQREEAGEVGSGYVEVEQTPVFGRTVDQGMLDHLGIARFEFLSREWASQEVEITTASASQKGAYLIFKATEVYTRLTPDSSIDSRQECCRHIIKPYAALERLQQQIHPCR